MTWIIYFAVAVVVATIWALVKKYETRYVLIVAGLVMALASLDPMTALRQFDKSMTNASLIIAICSAMGFAAVVSLTKCDLHLVALLTRPLKKLGVLLLPACAVVTGVVSIAIPSTAGCVAAVAPTLVPLMVRAGFHPAIAAAAVVCSITPSILNPGISHNVFVAKLADMDVMSFIGAFAGTTVGLFGLGVVLLTVVCIVYRDYRPGSYSVESRSEVGGKKLPDLPENPNFLYALAPLVPVILLIAASVYAPQLKLSVASAMLAGTAYALLITRSSPEDVSKRFFDGMGKGYANILGIIIAAGVFAAGLKSAGVIDAMIAAMTGAEDVAKLGAALGPFAMALMTGSGDAAAFAFNEAVTPHAGNFGMTIENLGYLAVLSGCFGRFASPLAGGMILVAGIAGVSPMAVVKRTAPVMVVLLAVLYVLS